jgi:hypothetical protein
MTMIDPDARAVIVYSAAAETPGRSGPAPAVRLLADSSATGGALSAQRVFLGRGAEGANGHGMILIERDVDTGDTTYRVMSGRPGPLGSSGP